MDHYSRKCHANELGQSFNGVDVVNVKNRITAEAGIIAERIQVGNGSEFISKEFGRWAYENCVSLDYSRPGKRTDNPFIESINISKYKLTLIFGGRKS